MIIHNPLNIWVPEQAKDDPLKGYPVKDPSGEVRCWCIGPGETFDFPDHVGKYLLEVYGFLQEVLTEDQHAERQAEKEKIEQGRVYTQVKIVKAEGEVVDQPKDKVEGFTNENTRPINQKTEIPESVAKVAPVDTTFVCPAEACGQEFKKEQHLKVHYALKHFEMPA